MLNTVTLTNGEYMLISKLVYERFGINLTDQKRTLIVERLQKTLRSGKFSSFKDYYEHVISDGSGQALLELVDKVSTNHTYFFRENEHFAFLKNIVIPQLIEKQGDNGQNKIRIWSAGCSTGEEAYTVAMILRDTLGFDFPNWEVGILATDIAVSVLDKAREGIYGESSLGYLPEKFRKRFFKPGESGTWSLTPEIKNMVMFRRLNLMNSEFPFKGLFDVIFCRNVMIYFDDTTRYCLVNRFYQYTEPNGYLFTGHSESLNRNKNFYSYVKPAIYQKK